MKPLNFSPRAAVPPFNKRITRRAWYVVFGAERIEKGQKINTTDLAERIHTLYDDINPEEIAGVLENYIQHRGQIHVES